MKVAPKLLQAISLALLLPMADTGNAQTRPVTPRTTVKQTGVHKSDSTKLKKRYTVGKPKPDSLQQQQVPHDPKYCPPCGRG